MLASRCKALPVPSQHHVYWTKTLRAAVPVNSRPFLAGKGKMKVFGGKTMVNGAIMFRLKRAAQL